MSEEGQAPAAPEANSTPADIMFGNTDTPPAEAPPAQPIQEPAPTSEPPATPEQSAHWIGEADPDTLAYLENKGWKSPQDVLKSYKSLESMRGVPEDRLLVKPADPNDTEAMNEFYAKLGRPETPEGYELEGEGLEWFKESAHKHGVLPEQAKGILEDFQGQLGQAQEQHKVQSNAEYQNDLSALKSEWGSEHDNNMQAAKAASLKYFGENGQNPDAAKEKVNKIVDALGAKEGFKVLAQIGRGLGEAQFIDGSQGSQQEQAFGLTPDVARGQRQALLANPQWQERAQSSDPEVSRAAQLELNKLTVAAGY